MKNSSQDRTTSNFIEHITEIRSIILKSLLATLIVFGLLCWFSNDIYHFFSEPLRSSLPSGSSMIATEVTSPFFTPFKLTFILSFFLTIPYILNQIWKFIAPALYQEEKKLILPLLILSIVLFYSGIAFAYYVVCPIIFLFFTHIAPESIIVMTDISQYLDFILKLFFSFGISFEIPIATLLLVTSGIYSIENLKKKRPYIIVICFIFGMLLTPPDIFSQSLLAIPMWLLFELGLLLARIREKKLRNNK